MSRIWWAVLIACIAFFLSKGMYDYAYQKGYTKGHDDGYNTKRAYYMALWGACEKHK